MDDASDGRTIAVPDPESIPDRQGLDAHVKRTRVEVVDAACAVVLVQGDALIPAQGSEATGPDAFCWETFRKRIDEVDDALRDASVVFDVALCDVPLDEIERLVAGLDDAIACLVHIRQSVIARAEAARRKREREGRAAKAE